MIEELIQSIVQQLPAIVPEIILTVVGVGILFVDLWLRDNQKKLLSDLAAFGALAALVSLIWTTGFGREVLLGGMFFSDTFSVFLRAVLYGGLFVLVLSSREFIGQSNMPRSEFLTLLLFAVVGAAFMVGAGDLISFYIGLELLSVSSYIMAGMRRDDHGSQEAALKYFLNGALSSAIILFGLSLVFGLTGTTNLLEIGAAFAAGAAPMPVVLTALVFVIAGLGFKVAAVPFHLWVPDTYQGAPTPVTAFLSVISKGAAFGAALRIFYFALQPLDQQWMVHLALLAAVTMTWGNVTALLQDNIKRLFGYSSIAQAGYILIGLAVGTVAGMSASLFYILAYMFTNLGAFAVIMAVSNAGGSDEVKAYRGLSQRNPYLAASMVIFFLSLVGIPFTAGFFGKFYLIAATLQVGMVWLAVLAALNSVISVGYYYKVIRAMYLDDPLAGGPEAALEQEAGGNGGLTALRISPALQIAVTIALVATLAIGIVPIFIDWANAAAYLPALR